MVDTPVPSYGELVSEAFIDPIRSVIVVDDEFPTLQSLLADENTKEASEVAQKAKEKVLDIISFCKDNSRRWMLEIHDSAHDEGLNAAHQSDLMILDFHLDPTRPEEGSDAIRILRNLATSHHFNLVVVYTNGYDGTGGFIERVVHEIAISLSSFDDRLVLQTQALEIVNGALEDWSDYDDQILSKVYALLDESVYLLIRRMPTLDWNLISKLPELEALRSLYGRAPAEVDRTRLSEKLFLKWGLHTIQEKLRDRLASQDLKIGEVALGLNREDTINWVRTDRLFVTVVGKGNPPAVLPKKLLDALLSWNPEPHRLLMSKMRATLDRIGVIAEDDVLRNQNLQAGWLKEYLISDVSERHSKVLGTITKHWEGLGDKVRSDVMEFARKLADHLAALGPDATTERWYPAITAEDVHSHLNWYACSKSIEGKHLTTGHVIELSRTNPREKEFWICLSPACDLVPGQKSTGWARRLGKHMPFVAAELFPIPRNVALNNAYGSNCLFLNVAGKLEYFSFVPTGMKETDDGRIPNPKWEQMFAVTQGRFDMSGDERRINLLRAAESDGSLTMKPVEGRIVAQLRYEYALNLLQKMGTNFSRIGLDFFEFSSQDLTDGSPADV